MDRDPSAPVFFKDLMLQIEEKDRTNFNKLRRHSDVKSALERLGLEATRIHSKRGDDAFIRPFAYAPWDF